MQAQAQSYPAWGRPLLGGSPYTADDVERLPDDSHRYEVYRGVLIRLPVGDLEHGLICQFIGGILGDYWRGRDERYRVVQRMGIDFTFHSDSPKTTMLIPDVSIRADNSSPSLDIAQIPPLIAIEVASPSDTRAEMQSKARFYLDGSVQEVWIVWPKSRTVDVWTANTTTVYTDQRDIISTYLPGWHCPVKQFFEG